MQEKLKRPCDDCPEGCENRNCQSWQNWFVQGWEAMNRFYAWHQMDKKGYQSRCFTYELPHMAASPCKGCCCESWCDTPCALRLKWWDERMARIRRRINRGVERQTETVR